MDDLITIDRQFVLDAISIGLSGYITDDDMLTLEGMGIAVSEMPPAQPEIIRCKDCLLRYASCQMVIRQGNALLFFTKDEDYCSYGKEKRNEEDPNII